MLNTSWRCVNKNSLTWWYALKMSWRFLEDVCFTMSWRRLEDFLEMFLQDVLKTFWRRLEDALKTFLQDLLKTSSKRLEDLLTRRLEDVLKISSRRLEDVWWRRIYWFWPRLLKTSSRCLLKTRLRRTHSSWWRSLEDEDERRLQDVFKTSSLWRMFAGYLAQKGSCITTY